MDSHLRHARHWLGIEFAVVNGAQPPWFLGYEHASVGQERETPWLIESLHHRRDPERMLGGLNRLSRGRPVAECDEQEDR